MITIVQGEDNVLHNACPSLCPYVYYFLFDLLYFNSYYLYLFWVIFHCVSHVFEMLWKWQWDAFFNEKKYCYLLLLLTFYFWWYHFKNIAAILWNDPSVTLKDYSWRLYLFYTYCDFVVSVWVAEVLIVNVFCERWKDRRTCMLDLPGWNIALFKMVEYFF